MEISVSELTITVTMYVQIKALPPYVMRGSGIGRRRVISPPFHRETIGRWRHHRNPCVLSESLHDIGLP